MWGRTKGISQCLWKPTAHFLCIINGNPHSLLRKGVKKNKIIKSKHPELPWSRCLWSFAQIHPHPHTTTSYTQTEDKCKHKHTHRRHHLSNGAGTPQRGISAAAGIALGSGTLWLWALCLRLTARGPCCQELSLKATGEGLSNRREMMSLVYTPCRGAASKGIGVHILTNISWGV